MRVSHLVVPVDVDADRDLMLRVAAEVLADPLEGLPRPMRNSAWVSAHQVIHDYEVTYPYVTDYLFMILVVVQARPGDEPDEKIRLRLDLENMIFTEIFGSPDEILKEAAA